MDLFLDCLKAFFVGGAICVVGQVLIDFTKLTPARILVAYVVAGVILTAIGLYGPIVDFAGAGATVPLTGYGFLGALSGGLIATSAGIATAIMTGFIMALLFRAGDKS